MDTVTIKAEWWCPQKRVGQTKKNLADEICKIAAGQIRYEITEDEDGGCLVRAELCVCTGEPDDGE